LYKINNNEATHAPSYPGSNEQMKKPFHPVGPRKSASKRSTEIEIDRERDRER
jgi:hypothetical protein